MNKQQKKSGFTLMELMIYITLVAGIMVAATSFSWNIINSRTKAFAVQEVQQNGRFIINKITQLSHSSNQVSHPLPGETDSRLSLATKDSQSDPLEFVVMDGVLKMSRAGGALISLSSSNVIVSDLSFQNLSTADGKTANVRISFTVSHFNPDNRPAWEFSDRFSAVVELKDIY